MYKVINEYLGKVNLQANDDIYRKIVEYVKDIPHVTACTVTVNFKRYVVDIKLDKFGLDRAVEIFNQFDKGISYPYSSIHVRFNEGSCVRYRYVTCREDKEGFYCDVLIR